MRRKSEDVNRRNFMRILGVSAFSLILNSSCNSLDNETVVKSEISDRIAVPSQKKYIQEIRSENRQDFNVRFYKPFIPIDPEEWRLNVNGLVRKPFNFTRWDLDTLPITSSSARMKCIECWSFRAMWSGFSFKTLANIVEPYENATWLFIRCADGYHEAIPIDGRIVNEILFAYRMNSDLIPFEYGGPLRIVLPSLYGYKWAKIIEEITFSDSETKGFWAETGMYPNDGEIKSGRDHPQEWPGEERLISGGAIKTY